MAYSALCCPALKTPQGSVVSNRTGMNFGRNILQVNKRRLTESHFRFDFTLVGHDISSCKKCCHLVSEHEASTGFYMQQRPSVPELYHLYYRLFNHVYSLWRMTTKTKRQTKGKAHTYVNEIQQLTVSFPNQ